MEPANNPSESLEGGAGHDDFLSRLRFGGKEALAQLYQENHGRLRRMIELRIDPRLAQRIDATDVLQEGFVDISNRLDEYLNDPAMPVFVWMRFLVAQRALSDSTLALSTTEARSAARRASAGAADSRF